MATRQTYNLSNAPDEVIIGSFRYYLGRKTYAVNSYCTWLQHTVTLLSDHLLDLIGREIAEAIAKGQAGMDCDAQDWENVLRAVRAEKEKRVSNEAGETHE